MRTCLLSLAGLMLAASAALAADKDKADKKVPAVLNFDMKTIDGKDVNLSKYQGKVIFIVNVASKCGYTSQYKQLQALHEKYAKDGLVVLGVPANEFLSQEPGTNEEIAKFCSSKYNVTFDMLAKVVVDGKDTCPLYKHLTGKDTNPEFGGPIKWNFTKFLVARDGEVIGRFEPGVKPDDKKVIDAIEAALKKK